MVNCYSRSCLLNNINFNFKNMTLVTLQIAIESIELQIEECKRSKKQMDKVVKNSSDYWNTRIKDLKMAQDELAMETFTISLTK